MKAQTSLLVGCLMVAPMVQAQQTKQSEREAMYRRYLNFSSYLQGGTVQPHWLADGSTFWFAEGDSANTIIWKVDPRANTKTELFDAGRLRRALTSVLGHELRSEGLPFTDFAFVGSESVVRFSVDNRTFTLDLDSYAITQAPVIAQQERSRVARQAGEVASPNGRWFVGVRGHNLWLRSADDGREVALTTDGVEGYEWHGGYPNVPPNWSPDSRWVAARKLNFAGTPRAPIVHSLTTSDEVEWFYYPKAGERRAQSELFVVDVASGRQVRLAAAEEPGPTPIMWRRDGSELLIRSVSRYNTRLDLLAADPRTGKIRQILTEPEPWPYPFRTPSDMITLLEDGQRFIWASSRSGWNHLYLYRFDGRLVRPLTQGAFRVVRVVAVDETTGWVYFTAQSDLTRPYDEHLCRVTLDGQRFEQLTNTPGSHTVSLAPSKQFFLDAHSSVTQAPVVDLRRADGQLLQTISKTDVGVLLRELKWRPPEEFVVKAADGLTTLYGVMYKPYDFDPARKYPVIQQTFALATTFLQSGGYPAPLAQLGYIVVGLRGRGSLAEGRGKAFENADRGHIGQFEIADQVAGLQELGATRPFMDLTRVGILDASYPGFIAIRAMLFAPEVYRVGVAVDAISDMAAHWRNEGMLGPPDTNREAYAFASNMRFAGNLKGNLLLIHGTSDRDVPISHTMKMVDALIKAGKPYDLLILPEQPHFPSGISWSYMLDAIHNYFQEHLRSESDR